jgi:phosphatidylglycerophosphate synthase
MITLKEIEQKTMPPEKRKSAKNDFIAFYFGRPFSNFFTIPLLYTNITPNAVSVFSIFPCIAGFVLMCIGRTKGMLLLGWFMFALWNLCDGIDGTIARYKKQFSKLGSVYDAMAGYVAMVLTFFGYGVAAAHNPGWFQGHVNLPGEVYIILGALSGIFMIFPRLVMHKAITVTGSEASVSGVKEKGEFGIAKIIVLNFTSVSGLGHAIMFYVIFFTAMDTFTVCYFGLNLLVMLFSLKSILKEN